MIDPQIWWHGSSVMIDDFSQAVAAGGVHFGTRDQARMRNAAFLHEVSLTLDSTARSRDRQSWGNTAARARRAGHDAVLYLNRFEGMQADRLTALLDAGHGGRLDHMPDREFRRLVPEAQDSLLVVNPEAIRIVRIFDKTGAIVWEPPLNEDIPEP